MKNKDYSTKTINGVPIEKYLGDVIGPMAASVLEMCLYKFLQNKGEGMTGAELKMVQFSIERTYGTAKRQLEVTKVNDQEIVAETLQDLDPETVRRIANLNAPRDSLN